MPLAEPDTPGRARPYRLAAAGLSLIAVCYGLARFAYGLFVPALRTEFGLDAATAGTIGAGSYLGYCVAIAVSSLLTSRWGARRVAIAAGLLAATGTAVVACAPTAAVLAVGVLLAGTSTGMASPPLAHAVALAVRPARRDRVQAVVNAGTGLGVLLSGPAALLAGHAWRWAWASFAVLAAAASVWVALALPRCHRGTDGSMVTTRGVPQPVLPHGAVRLLLAASVMGAASSAVWTFGPDLVVHETGAGQQASVLLWVAIGAAGLFGALTGDLAQGAGLARTWVASTVAMAASTVGVALAASSYPMAVVAGGLFGAVYITLTGVLLIWGTRLYPHAPAFGVGAAFLMIALGQAVGAPAVGWLVDLIGPVPAFFAAAAIATATSLLRPSPPHGPDATNHLVEGYRLREGPCGRA